MVTICQQCGDQGFSNAFVYCVKCLNVAVHRYCLDELPRTLDEFVRWDCEDCEDNVLSLHSVQNSEAIRHIPGKVGNPASTNHKTTSKAILRTNKKCHESSFSNQFREVSSEIDSPPESKLGGDSSPRKVNVKRKRNATNLVAVTDCSSHHSLDSHASIDCNEQSQSTSNSPSSLKLPKDMISIGEQGFDEQFPKRPCSVHSKPTLVGDSPKVIEGTGSSSCISHKKESKLGKETQLRVQTSIFSCNTSLSKKGNEPNISAHDKPKIGQPVIDIIWRGSFNIWNKDYDIVDGIVAHLSVKACEKVYKEACLLPPLLHLEMLPKSDVWPNSFKTSEPTDDNIALYFFPADTRCERGFDDLVNLMIRDELAMRVFLSNAELLVFTSIELPLLYWRFQGKYFIWGVFRGKLNPSNRCFTPEGTKTLLSIQIQ